METSELIKALEEQAQTIRDLQDANNRLTRLLEEAMGENKMLQSALCQAYGDEDFVVFTPDFQETH